MTRSKSCISHRQFSTSPIANIRLLDVRTLELAEFVGIAPRYAILSHTWGDDEVSFYDMQENRAAAERKAGYSKIEQCCAEATRCGYQYVWVDSCCIDKRSSAELSEAINSMYKWYQNAGVCFAHLFDVPASGVFNAGHDPFSESRWFTRGWTLQELIAPKRVRFFARDWTPVGTRDLLASNLETITGISSAILTDNRDKYRSVLAHTSVAEKMVWASRRLTTRQEDAAYCLMGLFNVNMPILYGEGLVKAFKRLQLEIIKMSPDQSIFAWRADRENSSLFADSPADFARSGAVIQGATGAQWWPTMVPYTMTNFGLSINLPLAVSPGEEGRRLVLATLGARRGNDGLNATYSVMIYLKEVLRIFHKNKERIFYRRVRCNELVLRPKDALSSVYTDVGGYAVTYKDIFVPEDEIYGNFRDFPPQK